MAGVTYSYRIRATGGSGNTTPGFTGDTSTTIASAMASAKTTASVPGAPILANPGLEANATDDDDVGSITLNITAPASGGSDLTSYQLQRWQGGRWQAVSPAPATDAETYTDSGLTPGQRYYYALRAMNAMGPGPWSEIVPGVATAGSPDTPTLTATTESETSIRLSWNVPDDNGMPITGYQIQKWTNGWTTADPDLPTSDTSTHLATQVIDNLLDAGATHYYRIRALPQDGDEGWSAEDVVETGEDAPEGSTKGNTGGNVPEPPVITIDPSGPEFADTANSITIEWAEPDDGGSDITGYQVYKWSGSSWVQDASLGDDVLMHTDSGLAAGTTYYYIVRALNDRGPGKWSTVAPDSTLPAKVATPVLTATATGTTSIQLTWEVPAANGNVIESYVLQRWDDTAGNWTENGNLAAGLPGDTTLVVDNGLTPGTIYYYQIMAVADTTDNNSASSRR